MRIGLVLDESLDPEDGVQQYVMRVGEWMQAHGHDVYYLVGETHTRQLPNLYSLSRNLKVSFNGNRLSVPLPTSRRKLRRVLDELRLDVLHIQTPYSPFMAGRLMKLASAKAAVVGTFHILPYGRLARYGSKLLGVISTATSRRFDACLAVSEPAAAFAKRYFGLTCTVVPNAFEFRKFYRKPRYALPGIKRLAKPANIVFLGRLVERKGCRQLLEAVNYLKQHRLYDGDFHVTIGGKGPGRAELEQYAAKTVGLEAVEFAGFVPDSGKVDFLAKADLAVFPSTGGESFGISLLEALAAARGVVLAGDNPGYRSVMHGFETQLFDPKDTEAFAEVLARYLGEDSDRNAIAAAQKAYVERFDIERVGLEIEAVYKKTVEKRTRA